MARTTNMIRTRAAPVPCSGVPCKFKIATQEIKELPLKDFLDRISKGFASKDCTMCEWLTADAVSKLVLDFDHENSAKPRQPFALDAVASIRQQVHDGAIRIIEKLQQAAGSSWEPRVVWLERSGTLPNGNHKVSIHVMIANAFLPWGHWGDFLAAHNPSCSFTKSQKVFDESIYSNGRCMVIPGACKNIKGDYRNLFVCTPSSNQDITPHPVMRPNDYVDQCLIHHVQTPDDAVFFELMDVPGIVSSPRLANGATNGSEQKISFDALPAGDRATVHLVQQLLDGTYGSGHRFDHQVTCDPGKRKLYFKTQGSRRCAHGDRHESNNCWVFLHSDMCVYYLCLAPSCKAKGTVLVGSVRPPAQSPPSTQMTQFSARMIEGLLTQQGDPSTIYETHLRPLMNRHFAVITDTKTVIAEMVYASETVLKQLKIRSPPDFQSAFRNLVHRPTKVSFLNMWLNDPQRRTFSKLVFEIDSSRVEEDQLNQFVGFRIDHVFSQQEMLRVPDAITLRQDLRPILDHVLLVLSNGNETCAQYMHSYFAHILQKRGAKTGVALVLVSMPGAGKGLFIDQFFGQQILGRESYIQVNNVQKILGKFNGCGSREVLVNLDEVSNQGAAFSLSDLLKSYITEPYIVVEKKCVDAGTVPHFANYIVTTNHATPVRIEQGDRRYFAVECAPPPGPEYFQRLLSAVKEPKMVLRYTQYLMSLDITNFHPQRDRPCTELYRDIMEAGKPMEVEFVCWLLDQKRLSGTHEQSVGNAQIYEWYKEWAHSENPASTIPGSRIVMMALNAHGLTTSSRGTGNRPYKVFRADLKEHLVQRNWYVE